MTSQAVVNGDTVDVRRGIVGMILSDQPRCNVKVFVIKSKVKWCVTVRITMISVRTFLHQKLTSTKRAGSTRNTKHGTSRFIDRNVGMEITYGVLFGNIISIVRTVTLLYVYCFQQTDLPERQRDYIPARKAHLDIDNLVTYKTDAPEENLSDQLTFVLDDRIDTDVEVPLDFS